MQPNNSESRSPPPPPRHGRLRWALTGAQLIVVGLLCGGAWTVAIGFGEFLVRYGVEDPFLYGTLLTAIASLLVIAAGVLKMVAADQPELDVVTAGKKLATVAFWLGTIAVAGYVLGFAVCLAQAIVRG